MTDKPHVHELPAVWRAWAAVAPHTDIAETLRELADKLEEALARGPRSAERQGEPLLPADLVRLWREMGGPHAPHWVVAADKLEAAIEAQAKGWEVRAATDGRGADTARDPYNKGWSRGVERGVIACARELRGGTGK